MREERKMAKRLTKKILETIPEYTNNFAVGKGVLKDIEFAIIEIIQDGITEITEKNKAL